MKAKKLKKANRLPVSGSLCVSEAEAWKAVFSERLKANNNIILDCSGIESIDTFGVQLLLAARRSALASGARIAAIGAPEFVSRAFESIGASFAETFPGSEDLS